MPSALKALIDLQKDELRRSLRLFACFFLSITTFWILKPLKKAFFVRYYDQDGLSLLSLHLPAAHAELLAKLLNLGLGCIAALLFSTLARRFRRAALICLFCAFFIACFAGFSLLLMQPSAAVVWSFYLTSDLYSTLMVAALFVFLNDTVTPESAKRSYGLVGLGAVLGGVVGSQGVSALIGTLSPRTWMGICAVLTATVALVALRTPRASCVPEQPGGEATSPASASTTRPAKPERNASGVSYLACLAGLVGIYEIVSTILDFQFTATVSHFLDGAAIGRQVSRAFALMNATALFVQLFVTSALMRRRGVQSALLVLPLTMLLASLGVMALPVLSMASLIPALDSGFAYSIHQSAKESLYVPLASHEKYGAKAFVDVFVMRGAKAIGVLLTLGISALVQDFSAVRWLSLVTIALLVPWTFLLRHAGRRFQSLSAEPDLARPVPPAAPLQVPAAVGLPPSAAH